MPDITLLGWFHTLIGILALLSGVYTLAIFKVIGMGQRSGQIYLGCTLVAAVSALGIYNQGGFGIAHVLAVLTLAAVLVGFGAEKTTVFGKLSPYLQAASYSATFLFHMIPAITDGLRRLPVNDPIVTEVDDPLLRGFYLAFLIAYFVGYLVQVIYLRRQGR
ncbi:MAG: hypothetical protein ACI9ON_002999 [Limisphaerales bacterium]|jgi:hypothetical protein